MSDCDLSETLTCMLSVWVYRQAVCRLSSEEFKLDALENRYIHLTNHWYITHHVLFRVRSTAVAVVNCTSRDHG